MPVHTPPDHKTKSTFLLWRLLALLLVLLVPITASLASPAAPDAPKATAATTTHEWYVMMLEGKRAGMMHITKTAAGATITTTTEMRLAIRRMEGMRIDLSINSSSVEGADGKPISMRTEMLFAGTPTIREAVFTADGIDITQRQGETVKTSRKPLPKEAWLMPAALEREVRRRIEAGETSFSLGTIDPQVGDKVISTKYTLLEKTDVEVMGRTIPGLKWKNTLVVNGVPVEPILYTNLQGVSVRTTIDLPGMKMDQLLADEALAKSPLEAPEIMNNTLVTPDKPIKNSRTLKRATYVLYLDDGEMPSLPSYPGHRVTRIDAKSVRVTVDPAAAEPVTLSEPERAELLRASLTLNHADEAIKELLAKNDNPKLSQARRAENLRRFVNSYIRKKSLDIGFATASEVARTKAGDCTEHGVLLAALLRGAGIPARTASGLIYADVLGGNANIFGYHMWTQALITDEKGVSRWVDLDAVLGKDTPTDATHIAISLPVLNDDSLTNDMMTLVPLLGKLKIRVEKTE